MSAFLERPGMTTKTDITSSNKNIVQCVRVTISGGTTHGF
jgi:hypothetical protein